MERHWRCRRFCRSSPIAPSMRSSNCPALPTNGRPIRSSSLPGASPTNMTREPGTPSANTSWVAVRFSAQPSKSAITERSVSRSVAASASARAEISAASGDFLRARLEARATQSQTQQRGDWRVDSEAFGAPRSVSVSGETVCETIMRRIVERIGDAGPNPPAERLHGLGRAQWRGKSILRRRHRFGPDLSACAPARGQTIIVGLKRRRTENCGAVAEASWREAARPGPDGERDHDRRFDTARARIDALRRRDRRRGSRGPGRGHPAQIAGLRHLRCHRGKGLDGRRAYPLGSGDRSDRA